MKPSIRMAAGMAALPMIVFAVPVEAGAAGFSAVCKVSAGMVGTQKYAALKCYKTSDPGNYVVRSTKWARDGEKAYRDLVRLSGRTFRRQLVRSGSSSVGDAAMTHYKLSNCH